ncbi:GNAT family N-acetyltransferase [Suttonella ornithocola]|uniref:N-acetyltransferase domain-containing protein n=1 Tax=Suttonella ornithocola TaxID=279832 RepID=A0A380MN58_9GAMM|nr:GNAT family protein [Suttonella ornithocola]SUO94060.1 Uncharacterised protein [Suttonella ornithocola]
MSFISPVTLSKGNITLKPLELADEKALAEAVKDGELWKLVVTSAPHPDNARAYIAKALNTPNRFAFAVYYHHQLIGSTSYYDICPEVRRVEIGYTWYGQRYWRTEVNTTCKFLLLTHAFEVLDCLTVGWRTDNLNTRSQAAIERLGAKKDGVVRGHALRKDGSIRDTVFYSMTADEWLENKAILLDKLRPLQKNIK